MASTVRLSAALRTGQLRQGSALSEMDRPSALQLPQAATRLKLKAESSGALKGGLVEVRFAWSLTLCRRSKRRFIGRLGRATALQAAVRLAAVAPFMVWRREKL